MTPITSGFHHITMVSADAGRTVRFYRDVLGLGLVKQTVNFDDPRSYHLYFGDATGRPGTLLTFFEWRGVPRGSPGIGGIHHLAMGVRDEAAQLKWKRWLTDHGVAVDGPMNRGWFTSIYFTDPDGQILELATAGPGYQLDEPADQLGQNLVLPPARQLRGAPEYQALLKQTHPEPVPALTPDMAISGIHHISGITDDIEAAHAFYTEALGLRLVKQSINQDDARIPHWFWAHYDGGAVAPGSSMTLFGWPPGLKRTRAGAGQTHHIAFRAKDAEQQLAWREHLESMDTAVSPVMNREYFQSIYFHAPDGLLLELATDGPGFLIDEPVESLGARLVLPAWLEGDRERIEGGLVPLRQSRAGLGDYQP